MYTAKETVHFLEKEVCIFDLNSFDTNYQFTYMLSAHHTVDLPSPTLSNCAITVIKYQFDSILSSFTPTIKRFISQNIVSEHRLTSFSTTDSQHDL